MKYLNDEELPKKIKAGEPVVMPSDTIFGLIGSALNLQTVESIYLLKKRPPDKPCIILINSLMDLKKFKIDLNEKECDILDNVWPGPVSIILPCPEKEFTYIHRGQETLAFRIPDLSWLRHILQSTGPLLAPSANSAGHPPAETIEQAWSYFYDNVFYYARSDFKPTNTPSTLLTIEGNKIKILRQGQGTDRLLNLSSKVLDPELIDLIKR